MHMATYIAMHPLLVMVWSTCMSHGRRLQADQGRSAREGQNSQSPIAALDVSQSQFPGLRMLAGLFLFNPSSAFHPFGCGPCCKLRTSGHLKSQAPTWLTPESYSRGLQRHFQVPLPDHGFVFMCAAGDSGEDTTLARRKGIIELGDEQVLDFQTVVDVLQADILNVFHKEPTWEIFAKDFHIYDQTGARLDDSEPKELLKVLRSMFEQFDVKEDIRVNIVTPSESARRKPFLVARWMVKLGGMELESDLALDVGAETVFHLNDKNEVDYVWIDNRFANGRRLFSWPELQLSDEIPENLLKIKEWAQVMAQKQPVNSTVVGSVFYAADCEDDPNPEECKADRLRDQLQEDCDDACLVERVGVFDRDRAAMDAFQDVLPQLLTREPDWNDFSEDFKLITEKGMEFGLGLSKGLLSFLRWLQNRLVSEPITDYIKDEYTVQTKTSFEKNADGVEEDMLSACWNIRLFRPDLRVPSLEKSKAGFLVISGETVFRFNSNGKISSMKLGSWLFNGAKLPPIGFIILILSLLDDIVIALFFGGTATATVQKTALKGGVVYAGVAVTCDDLVLQFTDSTELQQKVCSKFPDVKDLYELYQDLASCPESFQPSYAMEDAMEGLFERVQDGLWHGFF